MIIGVVAGGLGLVNTIKTSGKEDVPAKIAPQLTTIDLRPSRVPLGDYLLDTRQPKRSFSTEQLRQPGEVFDVGVRIVGSANKSYLLRWAMYERRHGEETRLAGPAYNQVSTQFVSKSLDHATTWPVWVPLPPHRGTYVVRFTLDDQRGLPVEQQDSTKIRFTGI